MPKKKSVGSLQCLCLENVADHIEDIWAKVYTTDNLDGYSCRDTVGPFSILAGSLVQELFQLIRRRGCLTSAVLRLFLLPQLMELDLSPCPHEVRRSLLQNIAGHCRNLSSLDLHGCDKVPADALVDLVTALPCLKKLSLSQTQCDTQVLSAVGSCCQKLCDLDIRECSRLSAESLFHLAYHPRSRSFRSQALQVLKAGPQGPGVNKQDVIGALVFLLLALPSLEALLHNDVAEAVCLIYMQQFGGAQIPPGFPPLEDMICGRRANLPKQETSRLTLGLKDLACVDDYSWPLACAVCPRLEKVSVTFTNRIDLGLSFSPCRHLTRLTISCRGRRDMRELLPVVTELRAQLRSFSVHGFSFRDKFSFHALLSHCLNLQKLSIHFRSPLMQGPSLEPNLEALDWDSRLPPHEFPQLRNLSLKNLDVMIPLPSQHIMLLKECLESLLKHSPCLERLELASLSFNLDEVFENVLESSGAALVHLSRLIFAEVSISFCTLRSLLSSDNELCYLELFLCTGIYWREYAELLQIVRTEGLKLDIKLV